MDDKVFQDVYNILAEYLPDNWDRLVFFAGYTKGSYSMKYYTKVGNDAFVDCFSVPGVSKAKLIKSFMDIDSVLSISRNELGNQAWTIFSMVVNCDGTMKTYFEYEDHSEDMVAYENEWKKKYLQ